MDDIPLRGFSPKDKRARSRANLSSQYKLKYSSNNVRYTHIIVQNCFELLVHDSSCCTTMIDNTVCFVCTRSLFAAIIGRTMHLTAYHIILTCTHQLVGDIKFVPSSIRGRTRSECEQKTKPWFRCVPNTLKLKEKKGRLQ